MTGDCFFVEKIEGWNRLHLRVNAPSARRELIFNLQKKPGEKTPGLSNF